MDFKIILKKLKRTLTEKEEQIFNTWYNESQNHRDYFEKVKTNYNKKISGINLERAWYKISKKINPQKSILYYKYAVAAIIFILLGSYLFLSPLKYNSSFPEERIISEENTINVGTNKAILTLADGEEIALEKGEIYNNKEASSNGEALVYESNKTKPSNNKIVQNTLTIPRGGQFNLILADGTKVWVNSETQLKYPVTFASNKSREVELIYGEAYFEVSPSTKHNGSNFIVHSAGQKIKVLGTEFNIRAYKDENLILTTLVEGKVLVKNHNNKQKHLTPGQQSIVNNNTNKFEVKEVNVYNQISWKDGLFSFKNTSLKDIAKVLSRWYDVDIIFNDKKKENIEFNGIFRKNLSIKEILDIIQNTNQVNYSITHKTITMN